MTPAVDVAAAADVVVLSNEVDVIVVSTVAVERNSGAVVTAVLVVLPLLFSPKFVITFATSLVENFDGVSSNMVVDIDLGSGTLTSDSGVIKKYSLYIGNSKPSVS